MQSLHYTEMSADTGSSFRSHLAVLAKPSRRASERAMHNLALVNPPQIQVAVSRRIRRNLPDWIRIVKRTDDIREELFEGIACQPVADAIRTCRGIVMRERLLDAIEDAARQGLVGRQEYNDLKKEFSE